VKVLIMYATAGQGHKKAAEYLLAELERHKREGGLDLDVKSVDLFDKTPAAFVKTYPVSYEFLVSKVPWLWGLSYWLTNVKWIARLVSPIRRLYNKINSCALEHFLIAEDPDVLLFTHFFPPEVSTSLRRRGKIRSCIVTVITDFFPHSTWINKGTDHFVVMTEESKQAVAAWGISVATIHALGIPVGDKFRTIEDKRAVRRRLRIDEDRFTVLMTSGAFGIGPFEEVLGNLASLSDKIQALIVCGKNKQLYSTLSQRSFPYPAKVMGFIDNMDELMNAADVIIAKSGGITTCESLAKMVPLIISGAIPGQEIGNADYLVDHDCAFRLKKPSEVGAIIKSLIDDPDILKRMKDNIMNVRKPNATKDIVDLVLSLGRR
jgi:processive 1,2-diacylglycerol beta-glucosyltransferase